MTGFSEAETILQKVRKAISDFSLLEKGESVLVSVSGGPDSTALLKILAELSKEFDLKLAVFHLNHMLRESASKDEAFVKDLAESLGLKLFSFKVDVRKVAQEEGISIEEAGRKVRYELLQKVSYEEGFQKVALGHTLSDNAETLLMRFVTNSNFEALKGIPPKREIFVRPLIYLTKEEVLSYLDSIGQPYCTDETNLSAENLRSYVRTKIVPLVKEINPSFEQKVFELAASVFEFSDLLERLSKEAEKECVFKTEAGVFIIADKLEELHPAIAKKVVFRALLLAGLSRKKITKELVSRVLLHARKKSGSFDISPFLRATFKSDSVALLLKSEPKEILPFEVEIPATVEIEGAGLVLEARITTQRPAELGDGKETCVLDAEKLGRKLVIRSFKPGDRMIPLGMSFPKKVHDIFVDEKVPREERKAVPIVEAENGKICWIPFLRVSEEFKVDEKTRHFALLSIKRKERENGKV